MAEIPARSWFRAAALLLVPVLAFALLRSLSVPVCHSRLLFGVPCPGCGLTRATDALIHLRVADSMRFHPLALPVLLFLAVELVRGAIRELGLAPVPALERVADSRLRLGLAAALVGLFAIRLVGGLGGLPDPVSPRDGLLVRGASSLVESAHAAGP